MLATIRELGFEPSIARSEAKSKLPGTGDFGALLARVVTDGRVDYARLEKDRGILDAYLSAVAKAEPQKAGKKARLAFYINAYNAATLASVLDLVKGKGKQGKDLGGVLEAKGFFKEKRILVAGKRRSLDGIERLGRALGDPRIHFAVNCASVSCPVLLNRAWKPETLDRDLDAATRAYLASKHGLRIEDGRVRVSPILRWYEKDFGGKRGVRSFLLRHVPKAARKSLDKGIGWLGYDWGLNAKR
ncbi:MAG: DUF547 domain-containing protein [Planctomycetota bacterium]